MPFHYHKRITLIPKLLHVTISRHGWSWSLGGRRAHLTRDSHGRRSAAVRLPGGFSLRRDSRRP
ncbi:DUF4236 domain-containing protein [Streptomyces sp. NPDC020412]|uniref:DUF4236 domain-containing protein n=1 Tax=Streptomyces sp. NPDC020412 TaxID=3365073 RepID=UPI0037B1A58E